MNKPPVLLINGLGDGQLKPWENLILGCLRLRGFHTWHAHVDWYSDTSFEEHLEKTTDLAWGLIQAKGSLAIAGVSAGGSMGFNVFHELPKKYEESFRKSSTKHKEVQAINLCGRLKEGTLHHLDYRTLARMAHLNSLKPSQSFQDSVLYCEQVTIPALSDDQKRQLFVVHQLADFAVPHQTMLVDGVDNMRLPVIGHATGIIMGGLLLPGIIQRQQQMLQI